MQQQTQTQIQTQPQTAPSRLHFPLVRLLIALSIMLLLALLFAVSVLSTGRVLSPVWIILAPALIGWIIAIFPVLQYFFPLNPVSQNMGQNQPPPSNVSPTLPPSVNILVAQPPQSSAASSALPMIQVTPTVQTSQTIQAAHIFHCNEPLPGPDAFFGREYERRELIHRTSIRASTAIDGEYRAGKSWLMQYLQRVAPTHSQLGTHVKIGKFSATHPHCQTVEGFVKCALETLNLPGLNGTNIRRMQLAQLAVAVRGCKQLDIIPVLCIDEFAGLIGKPGFDTTFLNELRSIAEDDGLVLITASRQPLHEVIEQMTGQTSPLFNIMPRLPLKPFTEPEARAFIVGTGQRAGFDQEEQAFFLECATIHTPDCTKGWPPLRLQLVGKMLCDDKRMELAERRMYNVSDVAYQAGFKQRLYEQYRAMVKQP